jgi:hypothetical protein
MLVRFDGSIFKIYTQDMATRRERGRPPKAVDSVKSKKVLLLLEPAEKSAFKEAADLAGAPLAVWIRERLRKSAMKELGEIGRTAAFLKPNDRNGEV